MTAAAILLKDDLASAAELIGVGGICGRGQTHKQPGDQAPGVTGKTRHHLFKSPWSARDAADTIDRRISVGKYRGHPQWHGRPYGKHHGRHERRPYWTRCCDLRDSTLVARL